MAATEGEPTEETLTIHVQTRDQIELALRHLEDRYTNDWAIIYKGASNAPTVLATDLAGELYSMGYKLVRDPGR